MAEHGHDHDDHGAAGAVDETPVSNSSVVGWGLLVMGVFWGTAIVSTSLFHKITAQVEYEKVLSVQAPELQQLTEQSQRLSTYGYVDADKQVAHVPIEEGMKQVILDAQKEAMAPAPAPVAPAAPAGVAPAVPVAPTAGTPKAPAAGTPLPAAHGAAPAVAPAPVAPAGAAVK